MQQAEAAWGVGHRRPWPLDPLRPAAEAKNYRGEDVIEKKSPKNSYRGADVNHLGSYGRWDVAELNKLIAGIAP